LSGRAVFGQLLPGFRFVADQRSSTHLGLQIAFTEQSFQPFSGNFGTIVRYLDPNFIFVRYFTHNQSYVTKIFVNISSHNRLTAIMT